MNLGFLVFPDVAELDFVGPWEMLGHWRQASDAAPRGVLIGEQAGTVRCVHGLSVVAETSFRDCPPLDYLFVPGGFGVRREVDNPALVGFIAEQAKRCRAVLTVCTGALLLHRAGLLSGKRATTHWSVLGELRAFGDVVVEEERFVRDGAVWSSAGVSAGIDLMLAFIASVAGNGMAAIVQAAAEYFPSNTRYGPFERRPEAPAYLKRGLAQARALPPKRRAGKRTTARTNWRTPSTAMPISRKGKSRSQTTG
jgi:transcriptional regulator GlxA family with amidase domain